MLLLDQNRKFLHYDLGASPRNPTNNFKFKNYSLGATNIEKNSDKETYLYSGCIITFGSAGS